MTGFYVLRPILPGFYVGIGPRTACKIQCWPCSPKKNSWLGPYPTEDDARNGRHYGTKAKGSYFVDWNDIKPAKSVAGPYSFPGPAKDWIDLAERLDG